jgi:hypothetical protein
MSTGVPQHCIAAMQWKVVVADESHMMRTHNKPPDAAFTEVVAAIGRRATRLLLLSGTPSLNRPFDLFRQVSAPPTCMSGFQRPASEVPSVVSYVVTSLRWLHAAAARLGHSEVCSRSVNGKYLTARLRCKKNRH